MHLTGTSILHWLRSIVQYTSWMACKRNQYPSHYLSLYLLLAVQRHAREDIVECFSSFQFNFVIVEVILQYYELEGTYADDGRN